MQSEIFGARQKHPIGHHRGLLGPHRGCPWGRGARLLNKGTVVCLQSIWRCPPRQQAQQRGSLLWACDWLGVGVGVWAQRFRSADVSDPPPRPLHIHSTCAYPLLVQAAQGARRVASIIAGGQGDTGH